MSSSTFAPATWQVVRITDGRREVLGTAPSAEEARSVAASTIADDLIVMFRNTRNTRFDDDGF